MVRIFFTVAVFIITVNVSFAQPPQKLWYKKPAKLWTEALPVGNGRLGAMVFGGVQDELLQLNEGSLWTGGPVRTNVNPGAYENLQIVRDALLKEENYAKAYEYTKKCRVIIQSLFCRWRICLSNSNCLIPMHPPITAI